MRKLLLLLACGCAMAARAQYVPGDLPAVPSPNAASLGQFGQVPVSFFTGMPTVEVPLYTLQDQQIEVPLTLRYHASGFRPDQHPGWVGMGWALEAGGVISRVINDMPDEDTWDPNCVACSPGYYFTGQAITNTNFTSLSITQKYNIVDRGEGQDTEPDEFNFSFGKYSGSFYWDAQNNRWLAKCSQAVRVDTDPNGSLLAVPFTPPSESGYFSSPNTQYRKTFRGFTITTEDGTVYSFGGSTNTIEYSVGLFAQLFSRWTANSWHLTKITHPDGGVVDFAYTAGPYICQYYLQQSSSTIDLNFYNSQSGRANFQCTVFNVDNMGDSHGNTFGYGLGKPAYTGSLIRPVYLTTITSANATITLAAGNSTELRFEGNDVPGAADYGFFNYRYNNLYTTWGQSPVSWRYLPFLQPWGTITSSSDLGYAIGNLQWKKLMYIFISIKNRPSRTLSFTYNDNLNERLTLKSVQESGAGAYKFDYNISSNGYPALPGYFADKTDHWGFYNNRPWVSPTNANMVSGSYYTSREPAADTTTALLGMLRRITYPTGGVTDFRFEPNGYGQQLDATRTTVIAAPNSVNQAPAGGVRLRATKSYSLDNVANGIYKEYFYVQSYDPTDPDPRNNLVSSGVLGGQTQYWFKDCYHDKYDYDFDVCQLSMSSQSILPGCYNSNGSHVGYSEVVEKQRDGGYTRYKFSNFDAPLLYYATTGGQLDESAQYLSGTWAAQSPFSSREQDRGLLRSEEVYNGANQLVKQRQLGYVATGTGNEFLPAVKSFGFFPCPAQVGRDTRIGNFAYYKHYLYSWLPASETTTLYDVNGANGVLTEETRTYNKDRQLATKSTSRSDGGCDKIAYGYPGDYNYNPANYTYVANGLAMLKMVTRHILNKPVSMVEYKMTGCYTPQITNARVFTYTSNDNDVVVPWQVLELNPTQLVAPANYTLPYIGATSPGLDLMTDASLKPMLAFGDYGKSVNPGSVTKPGGQVTTHLWDYNRELHVAKVENASPAQTAYTSFEADGPTYDSNGTFQPGKYTFNFDPNLGNNTHLQVGGGLCGRRSYLLDGRWGVSRDNIPPGDYDVTFWAKDAWNNTWLFVDQNSQLLAQYDEYTNAQGFHLLRGRVRIGGNTSNPSGSINIDAYGKLVTIDDVRLYPVGASMTTTTYDPLVGVTSSSDANNRPVFYEYDNLSRLQLLRNQDSHVVKTLEYNVKP